MVQAGAWETQALYCNALPDPLPRVTARTARVEEQKVAHWGLPSGPHTCLGQTGLGRGVLPGGKGAQGTGGSGETVAP